MLRKLLPVVLVLVGIGGGVGAGIMLRPTAEEAAAMPECTPVQATHGKAEDDHDADAHAELAAPEYIKMNNQFVIPVVDQDRVAAMVVMSLSLEAASGAREAIYAREPKLRDVFLQVLFDHANIGGFRGAFTSNANMETLRSALLDAARSVMGGDVSDVLITDLARQDV